MYYIFYAAHWHGPIAHRSPGWHGHTPAHTGSDHRGRTRVLEPDKLCGQTFLSGALTLYSSTPSPFHSQQMTSTPLTFLQ